MNALILMTALFAGDGYEWHPWPDGTESALMLDGRQVGSWNIAGGYYRPILDDGTWGPRGDCPHAPPVPVGGVDPTKFHDGRDRYKLGGKEVSRTVAQKVIADAKIPDHSSKLRVTVIGSRDETAPVLAGIAAGPNRSAVIAAAYEPTHWHVAQVGFALGGRPTIYVQDAAGRVLHRQEDFEGGAAALDSAIGKLRRPKPDYDPKQDPNLNKTDPAAAGGGLGLAAVGALAAGVVYLRRRKAATAP